MGKDFSGADQTNTFRSCLLCLHVWTSVMSIRLRLKEDLELLTWD